MMGNVYCDQPSPFAICKRDLNCLTNALIQNALAIQDIDGLDSVCHLSPIEIIMEIEVKLTQFG